MKKNNLVLFLTLILLVFAALPAHSQSAAEMKKMKVKKLNDSLMAAQQKENAAANLRRQKKSETNNKAVFGDQDSIFKRTDFPDKWNSQSAVILAQKTFYKYYTQGHMAYFEEIERKKIKILDKSAIEDLSVFYFIPTNDVGFSVIKKDGTIIKVNTDDAVPVDEYLPIPSFYSLFGLENSFYSKAYKKLAISSLEPGDIIDYYYKYNASLYKDGIEAVPFSPVIFTLTGEYPVVTQKIIFKVEKGFFINLTSTNGAPNLQLTNDTTGNAHTYALYDTYRDKRKDDIWEYPYRCEPTIKFQVVYSSDKDKDRVPYFIGTTYEPVSSVPPVLLGEVVNEIFLDPPSPAADDYSSSILKFMRRYYSDTKDPVSFMKHAYTYFRYFLTIGNVGDNNQSNFSDDIDENLEDKLKISSVMFVKTLSRVCKDKKINYDLLFMVPRSIGTLDNLIIPSELRWALRIKGSPDLYLFPFDSYRVPGEADETMEGIDAYVLLPNDDEKKIVLNKTTIPVSAESNNTSDYQVNITLTADMQGGASIARTVKINGLKKERYYPEVIAESQFLNLELSRYAEITFQDYLKKIHNSEKKKEEERKINASFADEQTARIATMKKFVSTDYTNMDSYDDFHLLCDGREVDSTTLIFTDKLKVKDVVHKVGANYILDIGKFIGTQLVLKDNQITRTADVFIPYAGESTHEMSITIPAGYKVDGIDALNTTVTAQTGGFTSSASITGNMLTVKTRIFYLHNFEPIANWADMIKYIQAASDFTSKKVLLKKA